MIGGEGSETLRTRASPAFYSAVAAARISTEHLGAFPGWALGLSPAKLMLTADYFEAESSARSGTDTEPGLLHNARTRPGGRWRIRRELVG